MDFCGACRALVHDIAGRSCNVQQCLRAPACKVLQQWTLGVVDEAISFADCSVSWHENRQAVLRFHRRAHSGILHVRLSFDAQNDEHIFCEICVRRFDVTVLQQACMGRLCEVVFQFGLVFSGQVLQSDLSL